VHFEKLDHVKQNKKNVFGGKTPSNSDLNLKPKAKLIESLKVKRRDYIPLTFDGLMVDFGQSAERNAIWSQIGGAFKNLMH
jgi:hypothetical protein